MTNQTTEYCTDPKCKSHVKGCKHIHYRKGATVQIKEKNSG